MNVKRIRTIGLVAVAAIVLAACGNLKNSSFDRRVVARRQLERKRRPRLELPTMHFIKV